MKYKIFLMLLMAFALQSCCNGDLIDTYKLSEEEKNIIPYEADEIIPMKHNQGYEFHANVFTQYYFGSSQEECEDYDAFELTTTTFLSEIPKLKIELRLQNVYQDVYFDDYYDGFPVSVGMQVNNRYFYYDEQSPLETVLINDVSYFNVRRYFNEQPDANIVDVLYNDEVGILRINYNNGDYVQINP